MPLPRRFSTADHAAGRLLSVLATMLMFAVILARHPAVRAANRRPNIIFVFADDHAYHAISAYGSKINKTPNIDRLANEGMLFQNNFCTNSLCAPSRAVVLTGKHSHLNGIRTNRDRFDGSQQTFPKLLQKVGYQTAIVGKWHLKTDPTGFDFWEVLPGQGVYYNPPMKSPRGITKHVGYTTDIIADVALDWLKTKRDPDKPFLLMYHNKAPHRPWEPGPKYLSLYDGVTIPEPDTLFDDYAHRSSAARTQEMMVAKNLNDRDLKFVPPKNLRPDQLKAWNAAYDPKNAAFKKMKLTGKALVRWKYQRYIKDYLRCIASVDENLGRVLRYLDESGLSKNTVVVYSSDQSFFLGDHGWFDKRWMYEHSARMPLLVRWPGVVKAGSVNRDLTQNLDFAETFLDIAGAPIPPDMQGRSLVPLLKGHTPADWRKSIYYHYWEYPGAHSVRRHYGVRTARYKLIHYYNIGEWELFDLHKDPNELNSVYADPAYADVVKRLKAELTRLQKLYRDDHPTAPLTSSGQNRLRRRARRVRFQEVLHLKRPDGKRRREFDPSGKPITVAARCTPTSGDGVLIAQGGGSLGYSLYLSGGRPHFAVRNQGQLKEVVGKKPLPLNRPVHLTGTLSADGTLTLYVNGVPTVHAAGLLIERKPADGLTIGADAGSFVGPYKSALRFQGKLTDIRLCWGVADSAMIRNWVK